MTATTAITIAPSSPIVRAAAIAVGPERADLRPSSISRRAWAVAACTSADPEHGERRADRDDDQRERARGLPLVLDAGDARRAEDARLQHRDESEIGRNSTPMPRNSRQRVTYIRPALVITWPHVRRRARRSGAAGRQVARESRTTTTASAARNPATVGNGLSTRRHRSTEPRPIAPQKKSVARVPRARRRWAPRSCGHATPATTGSASSTAVFRFGPCGAVEEGRLELAPAPLEPDPRERADGGGAVAGDRHHGGVDDETRVSGVVAPDPLRPGRPEIQRLVEEAGMRARGRIHDRVRAADDLELVVAPARALPARVLAVADLDRSLVQRLAPRSPRRS